MCYLQSDKDRRGFHRCLRHSRSESRRLGARALDGLEEQVYTVGVLKGEEFDNWWILPTKLDIRKSVSLDASRQLLETYKDQGRIFDTEIDICEPLNQSQFLNQDVFAFDGKSKGAEDYRTFAKELISRYG